MRNRFTLTNIAKILLLLFTTIRFMHIDLLRQYVNFHKTTAQRKKFWVALKKKKEK